MKKFVYLTLLPTIVGFCPLHAGAFTGMCNDWGEAVNLWGSSWAAKLASVPLDNNMFAPANCATLSSYTFVYGNVDNNSYNRVDWCATCPSGYTLSEEFEEGYTVGDVCYTGDDDLDSTIKYQTINRQVCEKACAPCSNCSSDANWTSVSTGYLRKTIRDCDCGTCVTSYTYTCAAGYYGSPKSSTSGCTKCPTSSDFRNVGSSVAGQGTTNVTDTGGAYTITQCHFKAGDYQDNTGRFTLKGNCYSSK